MLKRVFREDARAIVEKSGIPVAAIVSADNLRQLERLEAERAADFAILDEMQEAFRDVSPEDIEREITRAIDAVRAERCQQQAASRTP